MPAPSLLPAFVDEGAGSGGGGFVVPLTFWLVVREGGSNNPNNPTNKTTDVRQREVSGRTGTDRVQSSDSPGMCV